MLADGTHYEQVSLLTLKKILERKVIAAEEAKEKPAGEPGSREGNRPSARSARKES